MIQQQSFCLNHLEKLPGAKDGLFLCQHVEFLTHTSVMVRATTQMRILSLQALLGWMMLLRSLGHL